MKRIKVIGAGFGRTGTLSLKMALEQIGFGKCYHMEELLRNPQQVHFWEDASKGKPVNWDALFQGYQAIVDFPGYRHYRQLMQYYPDAKVILSVRDPEKWYESAYNTIYQAAPSLGQKIWMSLRLPFSPKLRKLIRVFRLSGAVWKEDFADKFTNKAFALEVFHRHNEEVKRLVPANRLLVYEVKQGWEPLCEFLGVPAPAVAFPRVNEQADFKRKTAELLRNT
jgi:hypothetical protein